MKKIFALLLLFGLFFTNSSKAVNVNLKTKTLSPTKYVLGIELKNTSQDSVVLEFNLGYSDLSLKTLNIVFYNDTIIYDTTIYSSQPTIVCLESDYLYLGNRIGMKTICFQEYKEDILYILQNPTPVIIIQKTGVNVRFNIETNKPNESYDVHFLLKKNSVVLKDTMFTNVGYAVEKLIYYSFSDEGNYNVQISITNLNGTYDAYNTNVYYLPLSINKIFKSGLNQNQKTEFYDLDGRKVDGLQRNQVLIRADNFDTHTIIKRIYITEQ